MKLTEGAIYHIYNRGNKQENIFFHEEDYHLFLKKIQQELMQNCEILAYCLMPNHFHFIVLVKKSINSKHKNLNNAIGSLLRSYTRILQKKMHFKGSLFQQKTKAKEISKSIDDLSDYLVICTHYIHLNPKRAGLVEKSEDWKFSSLPYYTNARQDACCNKATFYYATNLKEEKFLEEVYQLG